MTDHSDLQAQREAIAARNREILADLDDRQLVARRWLAEVDVLKAQRALTAAERVAAALAAEVATRAVELDEFVSSSVDALLDELQVLPDE
jgi:hypothetical protein